MLWLTVVTVAAVLLVPPTSAFLPTSLNYSDPDVVNIFCSGLMSGETWDHKAITREALRREVRRFFLESPPPANQTLTIPEDASLSQIFRAYYGPTSSPTRFIKAVNSITWSNAMTEASGQLRFSAPYHMDGESILQGHQLLQGRYQQLMSTVTVDEAYSFARELLGTSLNGIQDFYSQSTWVELGNTEVLGALGLPGEDIGEVAGQDDPTCTNCDDPLGECYNNVIPGSRLTSGYYEYQAPGASGLVVEKPVGKGKCSHGGSMDTSVMTEATGGINKETTSPCFSPHHHLHQQAVDLATKASELYLAHLRDAVGDEHFRHLLDLYPGSALSIIIDTTGSMTYELDAVKAEARLIVEKTHPELYILVPYGDPGYGPVTMTADADEFLEDLDSLEAFGGCCCLEEKFWSGLRLALTSTPDYSNIYCFTDAGANDAEIMEGVIALASNKHCKVNIVYSYNNGQLKEEEPQARSCGPEYVLSGVDEYKRLATITGGQFIEIDKFDVDEIVGILEEGVQESEVGIRMREEVQGIQEVTFPVDDSISQFSILLTGHVSTAVLSHPSGVSYDLTNEGELQASPGVEVITHTPSLRSIRFMNQTMGVWEIKADGGTDDYSIAVSATSTLSFLAEFCELDLLPPRPSYRVVVGRPLTETHYYVEVTLVGYLESQVQNVTAMELVDKAGRVLSHVDHYQDVDDHFYILSDLLPVEPFYVQIDGFLHSEKTFSRIFPTMMVAVKCHIELIVEASTMTARAGETAQAYFRVQNFGPEATFDYFASDEEKYISDWTPKVSVLGPMESVNITVTFKVPGNAVAGTVSTVAATASSQLHESNVNTAIAHFLVLPDEKDMEAPTCFSSDLPNCVGYDALETCSGGTWVVVATLQDVGSGMNTISSKPADNLTVDAFSVGTTQPVSATFTTSCCVRKAEIIGRDKFYNIGSCQWDLGELHGSVLEFVVESVGQTWVELRWTVSEVRNDLSKYSVLIDNDFKEQSRCRELVCRMNVTYLESCTLHTFSLTPVYVSGAVETEGSSLFTKATTLGTVPGAPTSPSTEYTTDTTTTVTWNPPAKAACLHHYHVCFRMYGESESECVESSTNTCTMEGLEACTIYHVTVASVSLSGERSNQLKFDTNTDDAAPGAPENLKVYNQTINWVALSWDDPLDRASCVDKWTVSYAETPSLIRPLVPAYKHKTVSTPIDEADNYDTISDLLGCTNYTFWVSAVSPKGKPGSTKTTRAAMDETDPTPVESITAVSVDTSSVSAVWEPARVEECVDHYRVCIEDVVNLTKTCYDTKDKERIFSGLDACVEYEVTVTSVSPSGRLGGFAYDLAKTEDLPTSAPTNLQVAEVTSHSATVSFGPPVENPWCVIEYDTRYILLDEISYRKDMSSFKSEVSVYLEHTLTGLNACSNYGVWVRAVTASGYTSDEVYQNFTTVEDRTSAPRGVSHSDLTQSSVTLKWFKPKINPTCAETYKLAWTSPADSGSQEYTFPDHPAEVVVTVTGLAACMDYTFMVTAVTPLGTESTAASHSVSTSC
ncbi:uncharacterized protein [Panulirus ornatus]